MVALVPAEIPKFRLPLPAAPLRRRSLPLPTTHHRLPTLFLSHPPEMAGLCFHTLTNPSSRKPFIFTSIQIPRGVGVLRSRPSDIRTFSRANSFVYKRLPPLSPLFALFSEVSPFVFNRLQPLFAKYRGWGIPNATTGHGVGVPVPALNPPAGAGPRSQGLQELDDRFLVGPFQFFKLLCDVAGLAPVPRNGFEKS